MSSLHNRRRDTRIAPPRLETRHPRLAADAEAPAARPRQHRVTGYAALEIRQP
jgi:hypothetical protein